MWIYRITDSFNENKIQYALAGGFAVAMHGAVRGTVDLDLVVAISEENLKLIEASLNSLGLQSRIPVTSTDIFKFRKEYIQKRNLIAWSFVNYQNPSQVVDIIITYNLNLKDIDKISVEGHKINLLKIKSLIKMKKQAGRPQDLEDVRALEEILNEKN